MINGGFLTSNGTKCSASQKKRGRKRDKVAKMELADANLARFWKFEKIPWPRERTINGQRKAWREKAPGG